MSALSQSIANLEIVDTGIIYRNPLPYVYSRHAYFPSVIQLAGGDLLASFTVGQAFEAADLHTELSRSRDQGVTWEHEGRLYPGTADRVTSDTCRLSHGAHGEVIAYVIRHNRSRKDCGFVNPGNLGFVEVEQLLFRSSDEGRTWSEPQSIEPPLVGPAFEMTSPIVPLRSGTWILPTSTWKGFDGYCPNGMKMVAFRSEDQGRSWPAYTDVMADERDVDIFWESKMVELSDGRILAAAWVYDRQAGKDRDNHYAITRGKSIDSTFTEPRSCGLQGQTLNFMEISPGQVLTVYRRTDVPGLWANLSRIAGDEWVNESERPLWGSGQAGLTSNSGNMAADFIALRFGAPSLIRIDAGLIFVSFWAVEEGVGNIRWIKLRVID
ncbi:sialidase family protein [Paenibacillus cymbidii]|uniref:sialidase family protein n=1 Tax=Paenibacillus cymbidii TaxID=1639034 RepID=UPI0010811587|nr:sialidase family protein [Paenibacillus cymbidii]